MTYLLLSFVSSVTVNALNDVQRSFVESHKCQSAMTQMFDRDFFAKPSTTSRQIARTRNSEASIYEYAIWDKENNKLNYVRFTDSVTGQDKFKALQVNAPEEAGDKYVLAEKWFSCPVSFNPKKGVLNKASVLYSNPTSYEDCSDKMGVKEVKATPMENIDRNLANIFEEAVVNQFERSDNKFFMSLLSSPGAPNPKIKRSVDAGRIRRLLPKIRSACANVSSQKIRAALAGYEERVYTAFPVLRPVKSKSQRKQNGSQ